MAREKNTYEKRQRETKKRQKAEDKRARRLKKKNAPGAGPEAEPNDGSLDVSEVLSSS